MNEEHNYDLARPWKHLDDWQQDVLKCEGNIVMRSGRQVGKSAIIGIKVGEYAVKNAKKVVLIIAKTERQARLLFQKVIAYVQEKYESYIKRGLDRPTNYELKLTNGTIVYCLPAGDNGYGIMGYTVNLLVADEAAFIPEEVWNSVLPTLTVARGKVILLSTPFMKEGYYYNCFTDPTFTKFHQSSEDCPRRDDAFLAQQKKTLTKQQYAQMYLGEFLENAMQFFPEELILETCVGNKAKTQFGSNWSYFLGMDIASMGEDDTTFEVLAEEDGKVRHAQSIVTQKMRVTETVRDVIRLNEQYNFNKIGLDDGGLGVGVLHPLLEESATKWKVVGLNNASRSIDAEDRQKKLLKEDMYQNLKGFMERGEIELLDDDEVKASLRSIVYVDGKIVGTDSHIAEGLIRAAWLIKTKGLKLFCSSY